MSVEPEKQAEIETHPLWEQYKEAQELIIELRPIAEAGNVAANERIDNLEARLTEIVEKIGKDLSLIHFRLRDNEKPIQ